MNRHTTTTIMLSKARKKATNKASSTSSRSAAEPKAKADALVSALKKKASGQFRKDMADRYGIITDNALGVAMNQIKALAKTTTKGMDPSDRHNLAEALWKTGVYEARTLAAFIDDPSLVTPAQMDRWRRDFDNWAIVDTLCFHLFDKSPYAFKKVDQWSRLRDEFGKRAAFALLACLALHDKTAPDDDFLNRLPLIEAAASDDRNFVKKAVSWALRAVGSRTPKRKAAARKLANNLAASDNPTERWVGKDALRKLK